MRKIIVVILLSAIFAACHQPENNQTVVTVSIAPQKYFAEKILPEGVLVNVMIPPGASPTTYEPTPLQVQQLSNSKAYIRIGAIEFEKAWIKKLADNAPEVTFYDSSESIDLLSDSHHDEDPHIWMSPVQSKKIAKNMAHAFAVEFPDQEKLILKNMIALLKEIDQLHDSIKTMMKPHAGKEFFIYHPALSYFSQDYLLHQHAIEHHGKEPSVSGMQHLLEHGQKKDINTIFIQKQFHQSKAQTIAKELNAEVVEIDPLSENWKETVLDIANKLSKSFE